jgi:nucleotide-binding universal stress UspA family protein
VKGYRRVLLALDFSPDWARVVEAARDVAESGAAIALLHVVEWVPSVVEGSVAGYGAPHQLRALHAESERRLHAVARELTGFQPEVHVVEGQPAGTILDVADEWKAELVIVGGRRRARFAGLRPGGVVERVLRRARVPVLVVPS